MIIHVRNDDYDITRQLRSIILRTNILLRTFSKCSIEVKLHLFQSYCTNLYCSHLWHIYTKTQLNKLRITYNNALRRLFNLHPRCSASAMFAYSHMPSLDEIRRKYVYRFIQRLNCTEKCNLALLHVIHEHADILNMEAVVQMFICITKMWIYCVFFYHSVLVYCILSMGCGLKIKFYYYYYYYYTIKKIMSYAAHIMRNTSGHYDTLMRTK